MPLDPDERTSIITQAMEWKFGKLLTWERPNLAHTFGANDLDRVEKFEKHVKEVRKEVWVALKQITDDDLSEFQIILSDKTRISGSAVGAILQVRIERLHKATPTPINYGFGHPSFVAKFDHWARMPKLTLHEVSLLSLGADPSCMKEDDHVDLQKIVDRGRQLASAYTSFLEQRDIFRRCFHFTGFGFAAEPVTSIKRWVDDLDIQVHPEFYYGLEARTTPRVVGSDATNEPSPVKSSKSLTDQETETLFKLIAAMAITGYKFTPNAKRNQATADIQSDLDRLGIPLDQKTILKWVRMACDVLPNDKP